MFGKSQTEGLIAQAKQQRDLGNRSGSLDLYREAAVQARALSDNVLLAHILRHVGELATQLDLLDEAEQAIAEAAALYATLEPPDTLSQANTHRLAALLAVKLNRTAQAVIHWQAARTRYAALDIDAGVAECDRRLAQASVQG